MKVAIVTFEFEGLTKNGGIGTAYRRLAELLVRDGHQVTVIFIPFVQSDWRSSEGLKGLQKIGIEIVFPEYEHEALHVRHDGYHVRRTLLAHLALSGRDFDVVHAADNCGLVYVSLLAKAAGLDFAKTQFVIGAHGSPLWTAEANGRYTNDSVFVAQLDRLSVEMADHLVSPSQYMIDYMRVKKWKLPRNVKVIPNVNGLMRQKKTELVLGRNERMNPAKAQKALVFFGRLERRKGAFLFVEALDYILKADPELGRANPLEIVFLGADQESGWTTASSAIRNHLGGFGGRTHLTFFHDLSSEESLQYLKTHRESLVCMPSLVDNSPYVIIEAIECGADFLAARSGGQAELIDSRDHVKVLCQPDVRSLAKMIYSRLRAPPVNTRPSGLALSANKLWSAFHKDIDVQNKKRRRHQRNLSTPPLVSVIIGVKSDSNRIATLNSAKLQSYANIEIIEADQLPMNRRPNVKTSNPPSRNFDSPAPLDDAALHAARTAKGRFILFLDGGALADREAVEKWVQAALKLSKQRSDFVGFAGIDRFRSDFSEAVQFAVPLPMDSVRLAIGQCVGSAFTLWDRKNFIKVAEKWPFDNTHDHTVRPFIAGALALNLRVASVPRVFIEDLRQPAFSASDPEDQILPLRPLLDSSLNTTQDFLYCAAGLYREMIHYRDRYYLEIERRKKHSEPGDKPQI